jgi:hypothetical protein
MTPKEKAEKLRECVIRDWMMQEYTANMTTILTRFFELIEAAAEAQFKVDINLPHLEKAIAAVKAALPEELR